LLSNFVIEYAVRKVQEKSDGTEINGTHQLLVYADDINILGDNIITTKKNTEVLAVVNKEGGLEVNTEKTKYILISYHQN
jgi:hypothetical protein